MPVPSPPADELLGKVAELRAAGKSWDAVATALGLNVRTIENWPHRYPYRWAELTAAAHSRQMGEAAAESVVTLRRQLRSESDAAQARAADLLLRHTARKGRRRKPAPRRSKVSPQLLAIAAELEGLSDAELDAVLADLARLEADNRPAPEAGANGGG